MTRKQHQLNIVVPDKTRLRTLNALRERKRTLLETFCAFPINVELESTKRRKNEVEEKLRQTEHGIELFTRAKVFVPTADFVLYEM